MSSCASSVQGSLGRTATADTFAAEHHISLFDQERAPAIVEPDAEQDGSDPPTAPPTPLATPLVKKFTSGSVQQGLKREITKRKYAKFGRDRYDLDDAVPPASVDDPARQPQQGEEASSAQVGYLERSRAKARAILKRKRTMGRGAGEADTVLDILYENQRGFFFFGVPRYSSSSLLPSDPRPWQNAQFRTSPVDIRSAQVPDPSWEWVWKNWYVDMSRDVDEEGWEYSFQFSNKFAWHGNHPWFHSFVRRRRWLRVRRRRHVHHVSAEKAHQMTPDYFTIHTASRRLASEELSRATSREGAAVYAASDDESDMEKMDIADVGSLVHVLRKAAVDREKLAAVRKFVQDGGEELHYLPEHMADIMSLFIYQTSRRQLLTDLLNRVDEARHQREDLATHQHDDTDTQRGHDAASRHAENLMSAVKAAEEEVKKLEYWSDIKGVGQHPPFESDATKSHFPQKSFASKQPASKGVTELHRHAEDANRDAPGKQASSVFSDTQDSTARESSDDIEDRYSTAAESASHLSTKRNQGKEPDSSAARLGGVEEEAEATKEARKQGGASRRSSVRLVDPVPEDDELIANDPPPLSSAATDAAAAAGAAAIAATTADDGEPAVDEIENGAITS